MRVFRDIESSAALKLSVTTRIARAFLLASVKLMSAPMMTSMAIKKIDIETITSIKENPAFFCVFCLMKFIIILLHRYLPRGPDFYRAFISKWRTHRDQSTVVGSRKTYTIQITNDICIGIWTSEHDIKPLTCTQSTTTCCRKRRNCGKSYFTTQGDNCVAFEHADPLLTLLESIPTLCRKYRRIICLIPIKIRKINELIRRCHIKMEPIARKRSCTRIRTLHAHCGNLRITHPLRDLMCKRIEGDMLIERVVIKKQRRCEYNEYRHRSNKLNDRKTSLKGSRRSFLNNKYIHGLK